MSKEKNIGSLFKNTTIICFFFNLRSNPKNKLIHKQHFFNTINQFIGNLDGFQAKV